MIPETGLFCLILAFCFACLRAALPLLRLSNTLSTPLMWLQLLLISAAFAALAGLRVVSDFSVINVAEHSSRALPLLYKIAGTWGNHEGSMLLWVWVLSFFGAMMAFTAPAPAGRRNTIISTALGVHSFVCAGFLLFILFTSNPFARIFPPAADGAALNPLLQDIGLAMHPPLLYLGYVGFAMVFSLGVSALLHRKADEEWAAIAHPWIMISWSALTLGIGMGSWWAYRELGWGGWWFWDPVENASLLPWLAGTALLHSNVVLKKRGLHAQWVLLLAIITFSLSLLGTFLVRSGVLTSVHSFASDPMRGYFILGYMVIITGGALLIYALKAPGFEQKPPLSPLSREGLMIINNLFFITAALCVMLGTLYPLFAEWVYGYRVTVGAPYFNMVLPPLMVIPLFLAGIAPLAPWKKIHVKTLISQLSAAFAASVTAVFLVLLIAQPERLLAASGMALAAWLGCASITIISAKARLFSIPLRESIGLLRTLSTSTYAVAFAHFGAALLIAGITGSSLWKAETEQMVKSGQDFSLHGYEVTYGEEKVFSRSNHVATQGQFTIRDKHNALIATLYPEHRVYTPGGISTSEAAIYSLPWLDLYAVIGDSTAEGSTNARFYYNPMMQCIWGGFLLMAFGGTLSLITRKKKIYGTT